MASVDEQLAALTTMSSARLRHEWQRLTGGPVPKVSPAMLRLALAWEIQAKAHGGLSRATQQKLDQIGRAKTQTSAARPGMRLVREWTEARKMGRKRRKSAGFAGPKARRILRNSQILALTGNSADL